MPAPSPCCLSARGTGHRLFFHHFCKGAHAPINVTKVFFKELPLSCLQRGAEHSAFLTQMHPLTFQPRFQPSSTSHPAGSRATVGPGFALQNSTAQHFASQSSPDLLHQSLDAERFSSTIQHPKAHTAIPRQQGGWQGLLLCQQRHLAWWWESSSQHSFGFSPCPLGFGCPTISSPQASREEE